MDASPSVLPASEWRLPRWAECLTLAALPFVLYASAYSYGLLGLDDDLYYLNYPELHKGAWPGPIDVWKTPYASEYFPVTATTLWVDLALFGQQNWTGARVHQILWFVIGILGVRALVLRVTGRRDFAFWAALFFAVHPVCSESVLWLAQRKNLVAQALTFWSIERYVAMRTAESSAQAWKRGIVSWLLCTGAILSKTQGVCVPAVLLVYEVILGNGSWGRRLAGWAPFAFNSAVFVVLYPIYISEALVGPMLGGSRAGAIVNTGWIVVEYLRHLVAPFQCLSFYYATGQFSANSLVGWLGIPIVLAWISFCIWAAQNRKVAAFFWIGSFAALAPALNLVRQPIPMTDHYQHWAMWGWVTGVVLAVHGLFTRFNEKKFNLGPVIAGMLALLLSILTFTRVPEFQSLKRVLLEAVKNEADSAWGQASLVAELVKETDPKERMEAGPHALKVFECADAPLINPVDRGVAVREAAMFLWFTGKKSEARSLIEKESAPIEPAVLRNVIKAEVYVRLGDGATAAQTLDPDFKNFFANTSGAIRAFRDGSRLPHQEPPVFNLGFDRSDAYSVSSSMGLVMRLLKTLAYARLLEKNYEEAFWPAALWVNVNPGSAEARGILAEVYKGLNLPEAAARVKSP